MYHILERLQFLIYPPEHTCGFSIILRITAITSVKSAFVMKAQGVFCDVATKFLNIIYYKYIYLNWLIWYHKSRAISSSNSENWMQFKCDGTSGPGLYASSDKARSTPDLSTDIFAIYRTLVQSKEHLNFSYYIPVLQRYIEL
jgi:hypothetical protein